MCNYPGLSVIQWSSPMTLCCILNGQVKILRRRSTIGRGFQIVLVLVSASAIIPVAEDSQKKHPKTCRCLVLNMNCSDMP
jgi:hypothetical protein